MRKLLIICAAAVALGGFRAQGEDRTVSDAPGLVEALEVPNSGSDAVNSIYLEPGNYDVSAYAMIQWGRTAQGSSSISHIALGHVELVGKSDNPRDVVYGIRGSADGGKYLRLRDDKVYIGCYQSWLNPPGLSPCFR